MQGLRRVGLSAALEAAAAAAELWGTHCVLAAPPRAGQRSLVGLAVLKWAVGGVRAALGLALVAALLPRPLRCRSSQEPETPEPGPGSMRRPSQGAQAPAAAESENPLSLPLLLEDGPGTPATPAAADCGANWVWVVEGEGSVQGGDGEEPAGGRAPSGPPLAGSVRELLADGSSVMARSLLVQVRGGSWLRGA